ncbi:MAG: sulfatase [Planctomycetota bacterium]
MLRVLLAACALPLVQAQEQDQESGPDRPNVLFVLADDLGWMDVGFNNPHTFYDTPSIDRIAAEGMRFTAAYAACPVCSPTRASIMTGRHPARLHTTDYFGAPQPDSILAAARAGKKRLGRFQRHPLLPAPYVDRLVHEEVTLAEVLRERGYATFFAGKWHLGGEGFDPTTQGFDVNVAGHHRGGPYGRGKYFHPFDMPGLDSEEGDHLPARLAEEACAFIESHADEPWLCYLSFYSVHTPLMGRDDLVEKYERKRQGLGLEAQWGKEGPRKVRLVQEHAVYAAMVAAMDEAVGEVLGALDRLGLADDTIVVFFSDNGGLSTSEGHPTSNLPLRAGKGWLYEGGVREPCAVRWPGRVEAGTSCDVPIQSIDFLPTLATATGARLDPDRPVDGVDILPVLAGAGDLPARALHWHYPHHGNQGGSPGGAILDGGWKWIEFFGEGAPGELYRLGDDPGEARDLAADEPERAARMRRDLAAWRESVDATMPAPNPLIGEDPAGGR